MKTRADKEWMFVREKFNRKHEAFTLTELLTLIAVVGLLACVLLSVAFTNRGRVQWAQCANNLRQIGVGLSLYATEQNGYVPVCCWPQHQNPWQTYETCRVSPGTTNLTRGLYGLGLLFRTGTAPNPKIFYCPSLAQLLPTYSYAYYTSNSNNWPSTPVGSGDDNVRAGYNYYPQLRATEIITSSYGRVELPKLTYSTIQLEAGFITLPSSAKVADLNPKKSITTDLVSQEFSLSHRASGSVVGLNALFPDGHVDFQSVRGHNQQGSLQPFDPTLWNSIYGGPGDDPSAFRIIMNGWTP